MGFPDLNLNVNDTYGVLNSNAAAATTATAAAGSTSQESKSSSASGILDSISKLANSGANIVGAITGTPQTVNNIYDRGNDKSNTWLWVGRRCGYCFNCCGYYDDETQIMNEICICWSL